MTALRVAGLSEETVALLARRARERGVDVAAIVRELADLGLTLEVAAGPADPETTAEQAVADSVPVLARDLLGRLETDDPDYIWS